jgi:hypothetical protein
MLAFHELYITRFGHSTLVSSSKAGRIVEAISRVPSIWLGTWGSLIRKKCVTRWRLSQRSQSSPGPRTGEAVAQSSWIWCKGIAPQD